jgi:hypothetical protein
MAYEPKPNTGALFKNDSTHENAPLYKGDCLIEISPQLGRQKFYISAWLNTIQSGKKAGQKYMSLRFEPPQGATAQSGTPPQENREAVQGGGDPGLNDTIPFGPQVD